MATTLITVWENLGTGDQYQRISVDAGGNLYLTNNAETDSRLTGREWMGLEQFGGGTAVWGAIAACVREYGLELGVNVASQCGGYEYLTPKQAELVDAWNARYGR